MNDQQQNPNDPFDLPHEEDLKPADPNLFLLDPDSTKQNNESFRNNNKQLPPPIAEAAFIGPLGEWIRVIEPYTECSRDNLLAHGLTIFGAQYGRYYYTYLERELYSNLFSIVLGSSALARKGTAFGHLKNLVEQIDPEWRGIIDNWQSGEAIVYHVRDEIKRLKNRKGGGTEEVTVDSGVDDKRVLIAEEELSQLFHAGSRSGSTLMGVLRKAWDCPHFLRNTTKKDPYVSTDPYISLLGHMTVEELVAMERTAIHNGLLNRCLWFHAERARRVTNPRPLVYPPELLVAFRKAIEFGRGGAVVVDVKDPGRPLTREMPLSPEAQELWDQSLAQVVEAEGTIGVILARTLSHIRKVSLDYAILDCSPSIQIPHLKAAKAVVDHSNAYANIIFRSFTPNALADKVFRYLQREAPVGRNRTEIRRDVTNDKVSAADIVETLQDLSRDNLARSEVLRNSQNKKIENWFAC